MVDLPAPVGPTKPTVSPGANAQVHAVRSTGDAGSVAEGHALENDVTRDGRELDRVRGLRHGRLGGEELAELGDRGLTLLVGVVELHELLDRLEERVEVEDECDQLPTVSAAVSHHVPADAEQRRLAEPMPRLL